MFDIFCLEKWLKWLNEQLFSLESVKKCKKKKKILLTTCRSQKWHSKITYLMLEEWLHRLIKTVWLTDFSCSSVRDCRAKTLQEQKREYKYVEWKLCEANPLCALFIWYCRWKTKKVVLLCIHILVFYCAFKFKSPPHYKLNATNHQFHLLCLNAFINASPTHYWEEIPMPRRYAINNSAHYPVPTCLQMINYIHRQRLGPDVLEIFFDIRREKRFIWL